MDFILVTCVTCSLFPSLSQIEASAAGFGGVCTPGRRAKRALSSEASEANTLPRQRLLAVSLTFSCWQFFLLLWLLLLLAFAPSALLFLPAPASPYILLLSLACKSFHSSNTFSRFPFLAKTGFSCGSCWAIFPKIWQFFSNFSHFGGFLSHHGFFYRFFLNFPRFWEDFEKKLGRFGENFAKIFRFFLKMQIL